MMAWVYLLIAGLFEIGWPLGFKLAQPTGSLFHWICFSVVAMTLSGIFLYLAQREIPIGKAYAVWTAIGAAGTYAIGVLMFQDAVSIAAMTGLIFIISGVVLLKTA